MKQQHQHEWLPLSSAALIATALFVAFRERGFDDPFITYRYAANIAAGHGFVYNDGERVLSTTTPLYTLLLSGAAWLGFDIPLTSNAIGCLALALGGLALYGLARAYQQPLVGWVGLLCYPTFPLMVATLGGEMAFYVGCILWSWLYYERKRFTIAAILCALATLTRADGVLVVGVMGCFLLVERVQGLGVRVQGLGVRVLGSRFSVLRTRQHHGKQTPQPLALALRDHASAVCLDDGFDDGETEAGAARFAAAGFVGAVEAIKDRNQHLAGIEGFCNIVIGLSGEALAPAQIQDAKAAVRFLRANAQKYNLNPAKFGAMGGSAGGSLVALLGTSCGVAALEGAELGNADQSSCVQAVVDWFGPIDFLQMDAQFTGTACPANHNDATSPESQLVGAPIQDKPELSKAINAITYITPKAPAFQIQHGTADCNVPPVQGQLLYDALKSAIGAANVTLTFIDGAGHGGAQFVADSNMAVVTDFLSKYVK